MKLKKVCQQLVVSILGFFICVSLSGCAIAGYHVVDAYVDENGEQHFMAFGKIGPGGDEERIENENSEEEVDNVQQDENNYNSESIVGVSLKKGWTSSDHSILKGRNVSVKEDSILFAINLGQEKDVIISYDIVLDAGEYQLVYVGPDGTEQILQDDKAIQSAENMLFAPGKNEISILSNNFLCQAGNMPCLFIVFIRRDNMVGYTLEAFAL